MGSTATPSTVGFSVPPSVNGVEETPPKEITFPPTIASIWALAVASFKSYVVPLGRVIFEI